MENYTGTREVRVKADVIDQLYRDKQLDLDPGNRIFDKRLRFQYQNEYITLLEDGESSKSALARVKGDRLIPITQYKNVSGISPRNREQRFLFDALLDPAIKVVVITGRAGTGKSLLVLAAALEQTGKGSTFSKIILTRPMSWVGKYGLGALPGDVSEKFTPYLENYMCNLEYMMGGNRAAIHHTIEQYNMEFIPLQLIRGASWANSFIIADEVQVLDYEEMVALGTRTGENSKIVILGDLNQRDEKIAKEKTGIYKVINSPTAQASPLVAVVDLVRCERSETSKLFADIFEV